MDIACNIDDGYLKYCAVMLTSLFENNKDEVIHVHLIADTLSKESQDFLSSMVKEKYKQQIDFYLVGNELLKDCIIYGESHISLATYYRIFLESILPPSLSKILYLDCDLVVIGSLKELWNTDITNYAVGCVEDMWSGKENNYTRLQYNQQYSYFNAGVLLINLDYWRKINFEKLAISYIQQHPNELLFNDQDVLNALLFNQKIFLPFRWNMQDGFFRTKRRIRKEALAELDKELKKPIIIHYTGGKKPWQYKAQHPYKAEYFKYLDMTLWQGERPHTPMGYKIKLIIDHLLYFLRLAQPKYRECINR